jgi:hypothetical protein
MAKESRRIATNMLRNAIPNIKYVMKNEATMIWCASVLSIFVTTESVQENPKYTRTRE